MSQIIGQNGAQPTIEEIIRYFNNIVSTKGLAAFSIDNTGNVNLVGASGSANINDAGLYGASPSATAAANVTALQSALNAGGSVALSCAGAYNINAPALVGSHTKFKLSPGVTLQPGGTYQGVLVRTGNAEFAHQSVDAGVTILAADTQVGGTGQLHYDAPSTSLTWKAPGDTGYGSPVSIAGGNGKYRIPSATAGMALYVTISQALTNTLTYNVVVASFKGANSVSLSCTSNVVTATETAHGRKSGDLIQIYGEAAFNGSFVIEVLTADTYTYAHTRANGTSSTAVAYGFNDIELDFGGATTDGKNGTLTSPNAGCLKNTIVLRNVNDLNAHGGYLKNAMKYAIAVSACSRFDVHDWTADTSSDTIHPLSPLYHGYVRRINSKGGDNVIGIGNADYPGQVYDLPGEAGFYDAVGVKIHDITAKDSTFGIVRFYGCDVTGEFRDCEVDGVHGTMASGALGAVEIITDTALTLVSGANQKNRIRRLKIKNVTAQAKVAANEIRQVYMSAAAGETGTKEDIEIDGVVMCQNGATNKGSVYINCAVAGLMIKRLRPVVTPYNGDGVYLGAAAAITNKLKVTDVKGTWNNTAYTVSGSTAVILADQSATTVDEIEWDDFAVTDTSPSGAAVNGIFFTANGIGAVSVRHGYASGMKNLVESFGSTNAPAFDISSITGAVSVGRNVLPLKTNSLGCVANISDMKGNFAYLMQSYGASGTVKLRTANTGGAVLSGTQGLYVSGAGATYDVSGDLRCILSDLGRIAGSMVKTNAIAGTIPAGVMAVCDDSGAANSWKAVHNTTLVY